MNVLILTAKCGMGHYSASEAIRQEMKDKDENINIKTVDFFEYVFPRFQYLIYGFFNFMVSKCSYIYNFFYKFTSKDNKLPVDFYVINKIKYLLYKNDIDVVISTFPVCSRYVSSCMEIIDKKIRLYTYITDVDVNEEWIASNTDKYLVASNKTKKDLISKKVDKDKIIVSGIPVKEKFKEENKKQINEKKEILIMGGGLGLISSIQDTIINLLKQPNIHITLIAGTNEKLIRKYGEFENLDVIGYTNKVNKYMQKADLIITKAGGITMFEAIYTETPLYIITPFLTQEIGNANFIEENNIGKVIWEKKKDSSYDIIKLLKDEEKINIMKNNMNKIKRELEVVDIIKTYKESVA